jgi:acyl carrier protein
MVINTVDQLNPTEDRVIEQIAYELNIPTSLLNPYTDLIDDLYLDALDRSLLIARLEQYFQVMLTREEVVGIQTIRDAARLISLYEAN